MASKAAAAGQPEPSTGMQSRPTPLDDILHPAETMEAPKQTQLQGYDKMDVDTDVGMPAVPEGLEIDPAHEHLEMDLVQEQLAMEMGRHGTNGRS